MGQKDMLLRLLMIPAFVALMAPLPAGAIAAEAKPVLTKPGIAIKDLGRAPSAG